MKTMKFIDNNSWNDNDNDNIHKSNDRVYNDNCNDYIKNANKFNHVFQI